MKCPSCDKDIPQNAVFCPHCSQRISPEGAAAPTEAQPAPPPVSTGAPATPPPPAQQPATAVAPPPPPPVQQQAPTPAAATPPPQPAAPVQAWPPQPLGGQPLWPQQPAPTLRKLKTTTDLVCGIIFFLCGLGLFIYFIVTFYTAFDSILYLGELITQPGGMGNLIDDPLQSYWAIPLIISLLAAVLWFIGSILLIFSGIFCFSSGRGRKPAMVALPFMLFGLLGDIITLVVIRSNTRQLMGYELTFWELVSEGWLIYLFEILVIIAVWVLLPLKKRAKKKAAATVIPSTTTNVYIQQPVVYQPAPLQPGTAPQAAPPPAYAPPPNTTQPPPPPATPGNP